MNLTQVLGTDELNAYLNKYQLVLDPQLEALVGRFLSFFPLELFHASKHLYM